MKKYIFNFLIVNRVVPIFFRHWLKRKYRAKRSSEKKYNKENERFETRGSDFPNLVFYISGFDEDWCGLFAIVTHQLTHIVYAVEKGYIPIIDLKNYPSQYLVKSESPDLNIWEVYFEQPELYSLEDVIKAKNVVLSLSYHEPPDKSYLIPYENAIYDDNKINYWSDYFKKYIRIKREYINIFDMFFAKYRNNGERILGVLARGTDYVTLQPKGHPVQPTTELILNDAKKLMDEWNCQFLFLATEDQEIYDSFESVFGNKLIKDDSRRWTIKDLDNGKSNSQLFASQKEKLEEGQKYLRQIYLLSRCNVFLGGSTKGSLGVLLMTEGFEYKKIYNLGYYP
jgi:hypothetical protein